MKLIGLRSCAALFLVPLLVGDAVCLGQTDPYETYILISKDFQPVNQDKAWEYASFPSWTYMPWPYQWNIGYTTASGQWANQHGYNGFTITGSDTSALSWINSNNLRFYNDHVAGKGDLHQWDGNDPNIPWSALHSNGIRTKPVNAAMKASLQTKINTRVSAVKNSPVRGAYALDDEISWGHFVHPTMWQVTDDATAYPAWLTEIYGAGNVPARSGWITYDNIRGNLPTWTVRNFNASQLMDQWTFNDSYWNNFIGDLVAYANTVDPHTPTGFVGGQAPNAFGGYDYAKIMKKVQYIESYDVGNSNSLIRSFNPQGAIPSVTTHFYTSAADAIWRTWYYLAHGNRGQIGWVENWFDGTTPKAWHDQVAPTYLEADNTIGPLLAQATWHDDGVAILYNHASVQLSWIMDAQAHGSTWVNRNGDYKLGSSHMVRRAWENMLRDEGIQYNYLSYDDVIRNGISSHYKVLILPADLALSDAEARKIREFCANGGTVVADYMPGLWDQHGKGRAGGGVLDDMFGVAHDPNMRSSNVFGGSLWCEVNQDQNFYWTTYEGFLTNGNTCIKDASGYNKAVRNMPVINTHAYGSGTAVLMNLSPQWYNAYRVEGYQQAADKRAVFMDAIHDAGVNRWVEIENGGPATHGYEITYFDKGDRTILMLVLNPENIITGTAVDLRTNTVPITLKFDTPVVGLRNERTGADLGVGDRFNFNWTLDEGLPLSFAYRVLRGDTNCSGGVDFADYQILETNFGRTTGATWQMGDFDDDRDVDFTDYQKLESNFGQSVPEPASLLWLACGGLALLRRGRRS